ncbi:MAG: hypothetical protein NTU49_07655 [Gammaproteobacteria bacterium]|nr:hypothetical protein [Gammaproteobacteria bacterium]
MENKVLRYDEKTERRMQRFYLGLDEKNKRHYAALEAEKLGHGGIVYVSNLFDCSRQTIHSGIEELKKK